MGGAGAILATKDRVIRTSSVEVPVGSTVGAGDAVVAALAFVEDTGLPEEDAIRLAMATGAASVMQSGTQAADRSVIDRLVGRVELSVVA
jgi:1-phosphofructokinase